jgi:hypothetical protein
MSTTTRKEINAHYLKIRRMKTIEQIINELKEWKNDGERGVMLITTEVVSTDKSGKNCSTRCATLGDRTLLSYALAEATSQSQGVNEVVNLTKLIESVTSKEIMN